MATSVTHHCVCTPLPSLVTSPLPSLLRRQVWVAWSPSSIGWLCWQSCVAGPLLLAALLQSLEIQCLATSVSTKHCYNVSKSVVDGLVSLNRGQAWVGVLSSMCHVLCRSRSNRTFLNINADRGGKAAGKDSAELLERLPSPIADWATKGAAASAPPAGSLWNQAPAVGSRTTHCCRQRHWQSGCLGQLLPGNVRMCSALQPSAEEGFLEEGWHGWPGNPTVSTHKLDFCNDRLDAPFPGLSHAPGPLCICTFCFRYLEWPP